MKTGIPGAKWALLAATIFGVLAQWIAVQFPDSATVAGVIAAVLVAALGAGAKALEVWAKHRGEEPEPEEEEGGLPPGALGDLNYGAYGAGVQRRRSALGEWFNGS